MSRFDVFLTLASLLALGASPAHAQVSVSVVDRAVWESNPPFVTRMLFPVLLSAPAPEGASIRFSTAPGTATAPDDFEAVENGVLSIPAGATFSSIPVEIVEDGVEELDESFTLTLLSAENLTIGRATATGVIANDDFDDTHRTLSIGDASVLEGNNTGENVVVRFPITLATASPRTVSVRVRTTPGTASGGDFSGIDRIVSIPAGATGAFVNVSITEDRVFEPDETFTVTLSEPTNAVLGSPITATGTILDDDATDRTLSIGDASSVEGDNDAFPQILFPLTLSHPAPPGGVRVRATSVAGSAESNVDYLRLVNREVAVPEGSLSGVLNVSVLGDLLVEPDETFTIVLSEPAGAMLADATATGTIVDDDVPHVVTIDDATFVEGDSPSEEVRLRFPLTLSVPSPGNDTRVRVTAHTGTATSGSDFDPVDGYVYFPIGTREAFVEIPIHEDTRFEPDETLTVSLSPSWRTIVGEPGAATGTILNDDDDVTVSVTGDAAIEEGGAAGFLRMLRFALALDRPSSKDVRVVFDTVDGTATAPDDYLRLYSSAGVSEHVAIIPAGQTQGFAEVGIYQDNEIEPDESFTIELDPDSMQVGTGSATGTILNDDAPGVPVLGAGGALVLAGALLAAARRRARGPVGSAARR
jgi:chitinase